MKFPILFFLLFLTYSGWGQTPQAIPYQAVARNSAGVPLSNQNIKVRFSIRDSLLAGTIVYRETNTATTNTLGLFNLNVGMGTPVSGTFSNINWGKNAKFLQVEMDPAGGNSFTDLGTQQMMSVPYALFSEETRTVGFYARPTEISQPSTNAMIYRLAQQYCSSLVENGKSDWRMPTLEEFEYLRDLKNLTQTGDFWTKQLTFGYPQEQLFSINTSYSLSRINPIESYPYNAAQLQVFCIR